MEYQKAKSGRTEALTDFGCPEYRIEFNFTDPVWALINDLDGIVDQFVVPMCEQDSAHLRDVSEHQHQLSTADTVYSTSSTV